MTSIEKIRGTKVSLKFKLCGNIALYVGSVQRTLHGNFEE